MSTLNKFGQYVLLQVYNEAKDEIFSTDNLRVDFDVRHIPGWTRAKFDIYNLDTKTTKQVRNTGNYVKLSVGLHGSAPQVIAEDMYVSNAIDYVKVPDGILSLYTYSKIRKENLEKVINVQIFDPSFKKVISTLTEAAGFTGVVEKRFFPDELLNYIIPHGQSGHRGTLLTCLKRMGANGQYKFNVYTEGTKIVLVYKPDAKNVESTGLYDEKNIPILLHTDNMRSNPKIGPASLDLTLNLDPEMKPGAVVDISKLITAETNVSGSGLEVTSGLLKDKVSGSSRYLILQVQHKGSSWVDTWLTQTICYSPTKGTDMPTDKWWA